MSGFSAIIPVAQLQSANQLLESQGFGPMNFSVPAFAGPNPTHALFHAWADPVFKAAVEAIPNVVIQEGLATPQETVTVMANTVGASWTQMAQPLVGVVTPGLHVDANGKYWWVIQQYDTNIWPDPLVIPALIVTARMPGEVTDWVQPLNAFTAYFLVNAFTGEPDKVNHNGQVWAVSQGDGSGLNIWEPGVFGWVVVPPAPVL